MQVCPTRKYACEKQKHTTFLIFVLNYNVLLKIDYTVISFNLLIAKICVFVMKLMYGIVAMSQMHSLKLTPLDLTPALINDNINTEGNMTDTIKVSSKPTLRSL